jgi:hypothetical protein
MNIFISWSGERSHQVALLFKGWIKGVVQAAKPWVSSEDIESGTRWFAQISEQIDATSQGIICITPENKDKPWILYEAGALSKGQTTATYVTPLLIDLETQDITGPLAQFNAVTANKEDKMLKLVLDLNKRLPSEAMVEEDVLKRVFKAFWPDFAQGIEKIVADNKAAVPPKKEREEDSMIVEILNTVRGMDKRMKFLESTISTSQKDSLAPLSIGEAEIAVREARRRNAETITLIVDLINRGVQENLEDTEIISDVVLKFPSVNKSFVKERILRLREKLKSE